MFFNRRKEEGKGKEGVLAGLNSRVFLLPFFC